MIRASASEDAKQGTCPLHTRTLLCGGRSFFPVGVDDDDDGVDENADDADADALQEERNRSGRKKPKIGYYTSDS